MPMKIYGRSGDHQLALLKTMRRVISEFGQDDVERALAQETFEKLRTEWATRRSLKQRKLPCARSLVKRCTAARICGCECFPPGTDHPSLWTYKGKPAVFVSQPYQLSSDKIGGLHEYCIKFGLRYVISTYPSWHFPGNVLFVAIAPVDGIYWSL